MPVSRVHLLDHEPAIRQVKRCSGADGISTVKVTRWMARQVPGFECCVAVYRQQQIKLQEAVRRTRLVMVEDGIFPLIGDREIQQTVSINICRGNAARYLRIVKPPIVGKIKVAAGSRRNKEMVT